MKWLVNIFIIVLLVGAAFFSFKYMMNRSKPDDSKVQVVKTAGSASLTQAGITGVTNDEFLGLLTTVKNINFKDTVFDDPIFISLENFQRPLPDRPIGRQDPFAPIGQGPASASTSSKATSTPRR